MRKQPERGFYVKDGAIVHAKVCPDGAREIMPAEAQAIRSARPKPVLLLSPEPANVDLAQLMLELSEQVADTRRQIRELAATEVVRQVDVREIK